MKATKEILMFAVIILAALVGTNCTSAPTESGRPAWITKIPSADDESVYFVGYSGPMHNMRMTLDRAGQDARRQFAMWKESTVKVEHSKTADSTSTSIITKTPVVRSAGGRIQETWQAADGGIYVLMAFPKTDAATQE